MTDTTRRALLRASAAGLMAAPVWSAGAAVGARPSITMYRRSRFRPLLGSSFRMADASGRSWPVRLTAIADLPHATRGDDACFCLTLSCSSKGPPQGTYTLRRRGFSDTPLFVVPGDAARRTYQVVVNRA